MRGPLQGTQGRGKTLTAFHGLRMNINIQVIYSLQPDGPILPWEALIEKQGR